MENLKYNEEIDNFDIWDIDKGEDLLDVFLESIVNGGLLELLTIDLDYNYKTKIYNDFKEIVIDIFNGYKSYNYPLMVKAIVKLSKLYDFINKHGLGVNL